MDKGTPQALLLIAALPSRLYQSFGGIATLGLENTKETWGEVEVPDWQLSWSLRTLAETFPATART